VRKPSAINRRHRPNPLKLRKLNHHIAGSSPSNSKYQGLLKTSIVSERTEAGGQIPVTLAPAARPDYLSSHAFPSTVSLAIRYGVLNRHGIEGDSRGAAHRWPGDA
jgi:hypothetical protein